MQTIREYNEQDSLKLDETFKETLTRVRPYVLKLTCVESAQLCKVWLDKLNAASSQRCLRNEYLLELCKQLKKGCIGGIFSRPPPKGRLLPLPKSYHMVCISSSISDLSDYVMRSHRSCLKPSTKCIQHHLGKALLRHRTMDTMSMSKQLHAINSSPAVRFRNQNIERKASTKMHEQRISTLSTIIAELQTQNEYLKNQLSEYPENRSVGDHLYANISQLTSDVSTLKAKLTDVQKIKHSLEESYKEVFQEYQYTVVEQFTELKRQLEEARLKNEALDNSVAIVAEKLEEIIHGKEEETKNMEKQWTDKIKVICERFDMLTKEKNKELQMKQELLEKKDLELSEKESGRREEIEMLTNKMQDLQTKLETKIKDEDKLQTMLVEHYSMTKEEFNKIRHEIDHETQKQNQNLVSKINVLKKAVIRLEKSKEKLGYEYEKKMSHIIKDKDWEIKALQLRLQEQKNELCAILNTRKQSEVDNIVSLLEKRYRTLLAETEEMTETQTQEYLRKIAVLQDQVLSMKKV